MSVLLLQRRTGNVNLAMMKIESALRFAWLLLGVVLVVDGIIDVSSWPTDANSFASLRWWNASNIVPGIFALAVAFVLNRDGFAGKIGSFIISLVYALHTVVIIAITAPDNRLNPILAFQVFVISLGIATIVWLLYRLKGDVQGS